MICVWYETIFGLNRTTTGHKNFDLEFHGGSYDMYRMTVAHRTKTFSWKTVKNLKIFIKISLILAEYMFLYIGRYKTLHISRQYKPQA